MRIVKKTLSVITTITDTLSMILLVVCISVIFINTIMRYVFNMPSGFSEELSVICLVWMVFLALPQLERKNEQLCLTVLYNKLSLKGKLIVDVLRSIVTISLMALLIHAGYLTILRNFKINTTTQSMGLPFWLIYAVIPFAFTLMLILRLINPTIKNIDENKI